MLRLDQFEEKYFAYGTAFVNALVIVQDYSPRGILTTGQAAGTQALIHSTIYKSFAFTRLVGVFHILEDAVKGVLDGEGIVGSFDALSGRGKGEMLVHSLVMFCACLPFFALREIERALGDPQRSTFIDLTHLADSRSGGMASLSPRNQVGCVYTSGSTLVTCALSGDTLAAMPKRIIASRIAPDVNELRLIRIELSISPPPDAIRPFANSFPEPRHAPH
jgi:DNA-binding transcriptional LysR family regulator